MANLNKQNFVVGGFLKSSLIDYPEKISAIVFTQGCNFRCSFCHNPELLNFHSTDFDTEEILKFLSTRKGKLDAVVITGGEPTLQKGLKEFIQEVKNMNFLVKLDTNGSDPDLLQNLIDENLIDYVAMDIKAPLEKYDFITCVNVDKEKIQKSIDILLKNKVDYEFRTTVVKELLAVEDFEKISDLIKGARRYYLQKFVVSKILDKNLENATTYSDEEFAPIVDMLKKKIDFVGVR